MQIDVRQIAAPMGGQIPSRDEPGNPFACTARKLSRREKGGYLCQLGDRTRLRNQAGPKTETCRGQQKP